MKVCMLSYSHYETDNRVRRYAESLVLRGDSVDVFALRLKGQIRFENIRGVNVYRIQEREKNEKRKEDYLFRVLLFLLKSFIHLTVRHLRCWYSVIHVHSVPDFEVFATIVPRLLGTKVILDIHDIVPEFYAEKFDSGKKSIFKRALITIEHLCCSFAHHVIISNDLWRDLITSRSVNGSKCTTVINYPDETIFSKIIDKPVYENGPFTIIYPGSLNYHQGIDIAIKAMNQVRKSAPEIKFDIYGVGPSKSSLEELINKLELHDTVFIRKPLPLEEIAKKMSSAHLGIVPKRADGFGNEAFSTKILEFMILGVPVIAAETKIDRYYFNDSLLEFFRSGDENSLADKILYLFCNKSRRDELYKNALRFAATNSWNKKKALYFNIVDKLCGIKPIPDVEVQNVSAEV